jgi:hypothetical protein
LTNRRTAFARVFSFCVLAIFLTAVGLHMPGRVASAQQVGIAAPAAFQSPGCSDFALDAGSVDPNRLARTDPEWKPIIIDPNFPLPNNPPTILEGFVSSPPLGENSSSQATSEVAEEDIPWDHYTHDFTVKVVPDGRYQNLLSYYVNADGTTTIHTDMEVEWENASLMDENEGFQRDFGAVPEFAWPGVGDRVWIMGRWIFDCGHPYPDNYSGTKDKAHVEFSTEIHPPRALVTLRLEHPALDSFPRPRTSAPNFPAPQSYLPVTGCPVGSFCGLAMLPTGVTDSGPTNVVVTEADIFVSGNGGGANDLCSITPQPFGACAGHTGPIIPVNDRNYVFDIYPPGTAFGLDPLPNGTFQVQPPVPDASLQWRVVDHFSELPARACGGTDNTVCVTVNPIICLLDASTKPPDQTETGCPPGGIPPKPTRLRVILPFAGSNANYFAQSILLGWDDVPAPPNKSIRTFQVRLHKFTVKSDGESFPGVSADWRVLLNVGGQYRYISRLFDTNANNGSGIFQLDGGGNVCNGDRLTHTTDGNCFQFDNTPWAVSVRDTDPIHVAVGGYQAQSVESSFCRIYPGGCDPPAICTFGEDCAAAGAALELAFSHFTRIGTYEFDLVAPFYTPPPPFTTGKLDCPQPNVFQCGLQYEVEFNVQEVPPSSPPTSTLQVGNPQYNQFVSSVTPLTLGSTAADAQGFQYRSYLQGGSLPTYPFLPTQPYPVHWTHADLPAGSQSVPVVLNGADGPYFLQYSGESFGQLLEPRHTAALTLDNTPPVATITQPVATQYPHSASFTIRYSVSDGSGSGVQSATPKMDGKTTLLDGTLVANNLNVNLLTELSLGTHTFSVDSVDNVNNAGTNSVTFSVIVTAESIKADVTQFVAAGKITVDSGNSLLGLLDAAAQARAAGDCATADKIYQAFVTQVTVLSGKKIDPTAAQIMILDAQYLIAHCP